MLNMMRLVLVTPKPKPYRTIFTVLKPLNATVWILTFLGAAITALFFTVVSILESNFKSIQNSRWTSPVYSGFYIVGTLVGESIVDTNQDHIIHESYSLRILLLTWLIFAFIMSSGYSGNLRAFLLLAERDPPIWLFGRCH